jgi:hypothetical protein
LLTSIEGLLLRRDARQTSREVETRTFGADGFSPSENWRRPMPWSFVNRVVETERFILVYHGYTKDPFYLPKHAMSASDMERLASLLHEHLNGRPGQVQLFSRPT